MNSIMNDRFKLGVCVYCMDITNTNIYSVYFRENIKFNPPVPEKYLENMIVQYISCVANF